MLKNKIYKYFTIEIFKSFLTILFAFTAIAWTVRAVNFLDLIVDNGHSVTTYLIYSLYNITNIITKFIPLSFLLALTLSIVKFERQNELIILWTTGLNKIKLINLFFLISLLILLIQIIFSTFITPFALNKSRSLVSSSTLNSVSSVIKNNNFSDSFKKVTFFVENISADDKMMSNIFIRDESNNFQNLVSDEEDSVNTTILARKGFFKNNELVLFNGIIQNQNKNGELNNIKFEKTNLILDNLSSRTITTPKLQETSTYFLLKCLSNKLNNSSILLINCPKGNLTKAITETISRRIGMPIYIPLISLICSFLLLSFKRKKNKILSKYFFFILGFFILLLAEILVRYSGFSKLNTVLYFLTPLTCIPLTYIFLKNKLNSEKIGR